MPRGRPKKNRFDDLPAEWKDAVDGMTPEEIKNRVAEVALELEKLMEAKKLDQDLADKVLAAKDAGAVYREGKKAAQLRISYAQQLLEARGKV
jgi:hypothetical protein